jgi:hypothetical protein
VTAGEKAEAASILAFAAHEVIPHRSESALKLLESLVELDELTDFRVAAVREGRDFAGITVSLGPERVFVVGDGHEILICDRNRQPIGRVKGLRFNPATEVLEGTDRDETIVPTPGSLWPRRRAVAVVLSAVTQELVKAHRASRERKVAAAR